MARASGAAEKSTAKKSTAKKSPAKKAPAKKTAAKKAPAKKTAAKKTTAKKTSAEESAAEKTSSSSASARNAAEDGTASRRSTKQTAATVAQEAAEQLRDLTGRVSEGVTAVQRTDDGWRVQVQVLELRRIPETTDVIALYDVDMDTDGDLQGYRRVRRYSRGEPGEE